MFLSGLIAVTAFLLLALAVVAPQEITGSLQGHKGCLTPSWFVRVITASFGAKGRAKLRD
eukprot:7529432-Karenia_brevis.AAC.1